MADQVSKRWPEFFHIGVPRAGSTTMQLTLRGDPRVNVFRSEYFSTASWYLNQVDFETDRSRVNVLSAETLVRRHKRRLKFITTMEHVARTVPQARIIMTIREQRAWLLSRYKWGIARTGLTERFESWLRSADGGDFLSIGSYSTLYRFLIRLFPHEQIHVLLFETLSADFEKFFDELYAILGLSRPPLTPIVANPSADNATLFALRRINRARTFKNQTHGIARREQQIALRLASLVAPYQRRPISGLTWGDGEMFRRAEEDFRRSNLEMQTLTGLDLGGVGYLV